jgi:hypothetical protein
MVHSSYFIHCGSSAVRRHCCSLASSRCDDGDVGVGKEEEGLWPFADLDLGNAAPFVFVIEISGMGIWGVHGSVHPFSIPRLASIFLAAGTRGTG